MKTKIKYGDADNIKINTLLKMSWSYFTVF